MENKELFKIADAILCCSAMEYRNENLASVEAVMAYAENGMDMLISGGDAQRIIAACAEWLASSCKTSDEYYQLVEKVLSEY